MRGILYDVNLFDAYEYADGAPGEFVAYVYERLEEDGHSDLGEYVGTIDHVEQLPGFDADRHHDDWYLVDFDPDLPEYLIADVNQLIAEHEAKPEVQARHARWVDDGVPE